jgi:hypothetical protein
MHEVTLRAIVLNLLWATCTGWVATRIDHVLLGALSLLATTNVFLLRAGTSTSTTSTSTIATIATVTAIITAIITAVATIITAISTVAPIITAVAPIATTVTAIATVIVIPKVKEVLGQLGIIHGLAQGPSEPSIQKLIEQSISVIKFDIVVLIYHFKSTSNEVDHEFATFWNNHKTGLIELLEMKVASKSEEVSWVLVQRLSFEI